MRSSKKKTKKIRCDARVHYRAGNPRCKHSAKWVNPATGKIYCTQHKKVVEDVGRRLVAI
jgi:hypothetical protein